MKFHHFDSKLLRKVFWEEEEGKGGVCLSLGRKNRVKEYSKFRTKGMIFYMCAYAVPWWSPILEKKVFL